MCSFHTKLLITLGIVSTTFLACCQSGKTPPSKASSEFALKASQSRWQKWLVDHYSKADTKKPVELWALFSSGGFAGAGDGSYVLSVVDKDIKSATLFRISATNPPSQEQELKSELIQAVHPPKAATEHFLQEQKSFTDKNFHTEGIFDSFSYEFVHCRLQGGKVLSYTSLTMDAPYHENQSSAEHRQIIDAFLAIKDAAEQKDAAEPKRP